MIHKGMVSVIIPVYNAARYVAEAVQSALSQSYATIEVIVVNDGSTDESDRILQAFGSKIRYFRKQHEGLAKTRNFGLNQVQGEYVAFLDADDMWKPEKLQIQIDKLLRNPEAGMVYCAVDLIDEHSQPIQGIKKSFQKASGWIFEKLLEKNFICISSVLAKTEVIRKAGKFDENLKIVEDYDYWLRLSRITPVECVTDSCTLYRLTSYSLSAKKDKVLIKDLILARRYARDDKQNFNSLLKNKESVILQDIGYYYFNNDRFHRAKKCFYGSWKLHKTRIKSLTYYFLSILPKPVVLFLRKIKRKVSKT